MFSRWRLAIYSGPPCNFPHLLAQFTRRGGQTFSELRSIDRLTVLRAIAPIRFPANENYHSIRGAAFSSITANVESSRRDKSQRRMRAEI